MDNGAQLGAKYLQEWHDRHPGSSSTMLGSLVDELGRSTYEVLTEVVEQGPVLDLACGDGHLLGLLRTKQACLGLDRNPAELDAACRRLGQGAPLVRGDVARLPIATAVIGTVCCHYALMLLQPLEQVLAEAARVLCPNGLLASVLPASPPQDTPSPVAAFRAAWKEVSATVMVDIPQIQDDRALRFESLAIVLAECGFTSVAIKSLSVSKPMTVDEAIQTLLLTYLPDLLPPAGLAQLKRALASELSELVTENGTVTFVLQSDLVTARRP